MLNYFFLFRNIHFLSIFFVSKKGFFAYHTQTKQK